MNPLRKAVRDYLAMRRSLGFKLAKHEVCLREFLLFLEQKRASHVSVNLALEWATRDVNHKPGEWASRLSIVRGFTRHWSATDAWTNGTVPGSASVVWVDQSSTPTTLTLDHHGIS